jgi:hypothetical protein
MISPNAKNQCLSSPGLAIHGSSSALVKIASNTLVVANGTQATITAADAPSLAKATLVAPYTNTGAGGNRTITSNQIVGAVPVTAALATGYTQVFTLCANIGVNPNSGDSSPTITLFWMAGLPFANTREANSADIASPDDPYDVVVGWVVINNGTGSTFTIGTTALDTASLTVTYINNYAQGAGIN